MQGDNYWTRRRMNRRGLMRSAGVAGAGAAGFALVGCGDDSTGKSTTTATTPAGTAATSATARPSASADASKPVDGSYYSPWANTVPFATLDYHRELYRNNVQWGGLAYNNLIEWDDIEKGSIRGTLAAKLPEQPDQMTYVFTLRDGVKWQNKAPANGRAMTMDDIKFNIERQITRKLPSGADAKNFYQYAPIYSYIDKVEYTDAKTLKIKLKEPRSIWLGDFCDDFNVVLNPETMTQHETADYASPDPKWIVGTGPYIFDEYTITKRLHAVRNPDYFLKKAGEEVQFFDELVVPIGGPDVNARRAAFEQKQVDIIQVPKDVTDAIAGAQKDAKRIPVPTPNSNMDLAYNYHDIPSFGNPKIRQAIFVAWDRVLSSQQNFQGLARPTPGIPWAFTEWAIPQTELQSVPGYRTNKDADIKEARDLWAAGGGEAVDKEQFVFTITDAVDQTILEWLPAMLNKNLGTTKFSMRSVPVNTILDFLVTAKAKKAVGYMGGFDQWVSPDPRRRFSQVHTKAGNTSLNFWQYSTPEMEALVAKGLAEFDQKKAIEIFKEAQRFQFTDGGSGHLMVCHSLTEYLTWPYVHRVGPTFIQYDSKQLGRRSWIDQKDPTFAGRKKG